MRTRPFARPAHRRRATSLLLALLLAAVLPLAARAQTLSAVDPAISPDGRTPLVLIHGHCLGRETWTHPGGFADHARATAPLADRYALYHFEYPVVEDAASCPDREPPSGGEIRDLARALSGALAADAGIGRDAEVVLVAHGTGGLVARALMQELGEAPRVRVLITLATPHQGAGDGARRAVSAPDAAWITCLNGAGGPGHCGGDAAARRLALAKIVAFGVASPDSVRAGAPSDGVVAISSALFDDASPDVRRRYAGLGGRGAGSTCAADASPHVAITRADCLVQDDAGGEPVTVFAAIASAIELPPDLVVTGVAAPPFHVEPGKPITMQVTVKNQGLGDAGSSAVRLYASLDQTKSAADRLLAGALAFGALGPAGTASRVGAVTVPADLPLGTYYVIACADDLDQVTEIEEGNNCTPSVGTMVVTRPDLVIQSLTVPSVSVAPGGTFQVTDTTKNAGLVLAAPTQTRYRLSLDAIVSANDILLGGVHAVPSLGVSPPHTAMVTVTVPASVPIGAYYVIACADHADAVTELAEANNCRTSVTTVAVTRPDLVVSTLVGAPVTMSPGGTFTATHTVQNVGQVPSGASQTRLYLSTTQIHHPDDVLLTGTLSVPGLAAGGSGAASGVITVPAATPLGTYFVIACADAPGTIVETLEANNCRASLTTTTVGRPDLVVQSVSSPPSALTPGQTFTIAETTKNVGGAPSLATQTRYYLAVGVTKSAQDRLLAVTHAVPALAPNASHPITVTATVPATTPLGVGYHVLACADDTNLVVEVDQTNNCTASATTVFVTRPDLIVSGLGNPPAVVRVGDGMAIDVVTTSNFGFVPSGPSRTKLYLSVDTIVSGDDRVLPQDIAVPALPPSQGASSPFGMVFTIPAATPLGTYYVIACADALNAVTEGNEANNCLASATTVIVTKPDLVVSDVQVAPVTVPRGGIVPVTDTTLNQGLASALASTTRYYLSLDQVKSAADVAMTASRPVPVLLGGEPSTGSVNATVPANTPPGVYWVLACADTGSVVSELVETNNCRAGDGQVTVTP